MADFSTITKHAASDFNGGIKYTQNDQFSLDALNASIENGLYAANQVDNKTTITSNGEVIKSKELSALVRGGMGCQAPIGIDDSNNIYLNYTGALALNYDLGALYVNSDALRGDGLTYGCNDTLNVDLNYIGSNMVGEGLYFDSSSHKLSVDTSNLSSSISSNLPNYSYVASGSVTAKTGYLTNIKALHSGYITTYNSSNWVELSIYALSSSTCKIWGITQSSNTFSYEYQYGSFIETIGATEVTLSGQAVVTLNEIQPARTE